MRMMLSLSCVPIVIVVGSICGYNLGLTLVGLYWPMTPFNVSVVWRMTLPMTSFNVSVVWRTTTPTPQQGVSTK